MDGFELNKIMAALLVALIIAMVAVLIGEGSIHVSLLEKDAYPIASDTPSSSNAAETPKGPEDLTPFLSKADAINGEKIFKKCAHCHSVEKDGAVRTGPNLWNVVGAKLAHVASFAYSQVFLEKGGTWTMDALNHFLFKPRDFIKGTKMSFVGLSDPQERADVIAYLAKYHDNPPPLK